MNLMNSIRRCIWRAMDALRGVRFARSRVLWLTRWAFRPFFHFHCTITVIDGAKFRLGDDPLDEIIIADTYGRFRDLYFPRGMEEFPSGEWILDIGAHHGVFSVAALMRYPTARVIAIEPDPMGAIRLRANLALNNLLNRSEVIEAAIAAQEGTGLLSQSPEGSWANELVQGHDGHVVKPIRTLPLNSILAGRPPYFVKCNAEGAEFEAIPQLLAAGFRSAWIALFVHPAAGDANVLLRQVRNAGYAIEPIMSTPDHPRYLCRLNKP